MPMPKFSEYILHYFSFTKKERRSAIALLVIIFVLAFLPTLFPFLFAQKKVRDAQFEKDILALKEKQASDKTDNWQDNGNESSAYYQSKNYGQSNDHYAFHGTMFSFDPNTIDEAGWKKLGLREKTIATILNFRNKGGKFYKAEDIGKIWGLHQDEYERLLPYVEITSIEKKQYPQYAKTEYEKKDYGAKPYTPKTVEINTTDTNALIALPFIGSKLAYRITNFRDKLGGFISVEQIGETWGLQDSVFQKIKTRFTCDANLVKKLNINTDDVNALKHPYIKWNIANVIVQYHKQHGDYKAIKDLLLTGVVDETLLKKIEPYLRMNNE
jgi:competence protein ComEA